VWQDVVLMSGSFIFALALLPSLFSKNKPNIKTSIITAFWLFIFAGVYTTLDLWLSFSATMVTAFLWAVLAVQGYKNG